MVREHAAAEESARRGRVDDEGKDQQADLWVVTEFYPWPWVSMRIRINGKNYLGKHSIESFG